MIINWTWSIMVISRTEKTLNYRFDFWFRVDALRNFIKLARFLHAEVLIEYYLKRIKKNKI